MALGFGSRSDEDVSTLIARKNYARAIEVLRARVQAKRGSPRLRIQLADVLVQAGKVREAVGILTPLADEYARDGFAAKAVAILKKIQKIDPSRRDVDARLASLIQEKQRVAAAAVPAAGLPEIGIEEIGLELPIAGPIVVSAEPPSRAAPAAPPPETAPPREAPPSPAAADDESSLPTLHLEPPEPFTLVPAPPPPAAAEPPAARAVSTIEDPDLLFMEGLTEADELAEEEGAVEAEPEVEGREPESADPMSDGRFAEELQALVDSAFPPLAEDASPPAPLERGGSHIVVSPLFRDFSVDEMVAVIHGLNLLSFKRGDVILREGDAGDSLYMLTSGMVRAFRKDGSGRQVRLADLREGAFFGEGSILTGGPRTATVAALTPCELLELDRSTLDSIRRTHPRVWDVLEEFARKRGARKA
ncbi:MAG TPA: cyclic nucleotide-binding domain-containing protein [Vicinamibacteria bacterium]|nr:cyclic nucleotide-binding domain-containing protein [Vicinamibacteria bacterium]